MWTHQTTSHSISEKILLTFFSRFPSLGIFTGLVTAWATDWGRRGVPRGLPGAFWGPRGPKNRFLGFLGAGGASRLASLLALSWANRALLALFGFLCPGHC